MGGGNDADGRDDRALKGDGDEGQREGDRACVAGRQREEENMGTRKILAWECMLTCLPGRMAYEPTLGTTAAMPQRALVPLASCP